METCMEPSGPGQAGCRHILTPGSDIKLGLMKNNVCYVPLREESLLSSTSGKEDQVVWYLAA